MARGVEPAAKSPMAAEITGAAGGVASTVSTNGWDTAAGLELTIAVAVKANVPSLKAGGTNVKVPAVDVSLAKPSDTPSLKISTIAPVVAKMVSVGAVLLVSPPLPRKFAVMIGAGSEAMGGSTIFGVITGVR